MQNVLAQSLRRGCGTVVTAKTRNTVQACPRGRAACEPSTSGRPLLHVARCAHGANGGDYIDGDSMRPNYSQPDPSTGDDLHEGSSSQLLPPSHWAKLFASYSHDWPIMSANGSLDSWDFSNDDDLVPAPANTPTSEQDVLYAPRRDMWCLTDRPGIDLLLASPATLAKLTQVHVILFGVGERDQEGIYSLRAFCEEGLPQETIIAFETEEDAERYAGLLEATMDHTPSVCGIAPRELLDFCGGQGYACRLEPRGSLLIPPDFNVGVTDWERSMRLRDGRWAVLEAEPAAESASSASSGASSSSSPYSRNGPVQTAPPPPSSLPGSLASSSSSSPASSSPSSASPASSSSSSSSQQGPAGSPSLSSNLQPSRQPAVNGSALARYLPSFSDTELVAIKAQLERLLPADNDTGSSSSSSSSGAPSEPRQ